jgi:hypothetical protein
MFKNLYGVSTPRLEEIEERLYDVFDDDLPEEAKRTRTDILLRKDIPYLIRNASDCLVLLKEASKCVCSLDCPSVWKTGTIPPHCDLCKNIKKVIESMEENNMTPEEKSAALKDEAKTILNRLFKVPIGYENNDVERVIDCIIEATVYRVAEAVRRSNVHIATSDNP